MQDPGLGQPPIPNNPPPTNNAWQGNAPYSPPGPPPPGSPPQYNPPPPGADKKLAAGLTALLLGPLGIHKFILGYNNEGIITVCCSLFTCGIGWGVMHIIGIIEGIIYLTK